ncbi:MAG: hypothetical protein QM813_09420 [Verrucomicrobiota bacterium]
MTPVLHIGKVFGAVISLRLQKTVVTKTVQTPAKDAPQARERINAMVKEVWPGWKMAYVVAPKKLGGGQ